MSSLSRRSSPLRIAVLECDEPIGRTKEKYGGYGNLFQELLENGAKQLVEKGERKEDGVEMEILKYDVVNHEVYPELESLDGVLLTGSSEFALMKGRGRGRGRDRQREREGKADWKDRI